MDAQHREINKISVGIHDCSYFKENLVCSYVNLLFSAFVFLA